MKEGTSVTLSDVPTPKVETDQDVLIRVMVAGICRTDLDVARGRLDAAASVILGHELCGTVAEAGSTAGFAEGDLVTVMPVISCNACDACLSGRVLACRERKMLGVDRHGAFADYVLVPSDFVYRLPDFAQTANAGDAIPFLRGAYTEPVAASLAVLNAKIQKKERGLIVGQNRIAQLTHRILEAHGFSHVDREHQDTTYDFGIETETSALGLLIEAVKPGGRIVLKSRPYRSVAIDLTTAVQKELTFQAVAYGSFDTSITLLAEERIAVDDLFGPSFSLEDHKEAFSCSESSEERKCFLQMNR